MAAVLVVKNTENGEEEKELHPSRIIIYLKKITITELT
jgi:hypothetical protein